MEHITAQPILTLSDIFKKNQSSSKFVSQASMAGSTNCHQVKRQNMPMSLFAIIIVIMLVISFQNFLLFFTAQAIPKIVYATTCLFVFVLIMIGISLHFSNFKQMMALYFLLDSIALSLIAAVIGLFGLTTSITRSSPLFAGIVRVLVPITLFVLSGTIRVIIKWANFKRWQNILFKISLFLSGLTYFVIGFYIMYFEYLPSKGMLPPTDASFKDFSLLYAFGSLALYKQFVNLHNNFDHTKRLKYEYKLLDQIQQKVIQQQQFLSSQDKSKKYQER